MEEKISIVDDMKQCMTTYGVIVLVITILNILIGDLATSLDASLFAFGASGLSTGSLLQLFLLAVIITVGQIIFLTDRVIERMSLGGRIAVFLAVVTIAMVGMICAFGWFPINSAGAWAGFFVCFAICTAVSVTISVTREKAENRKMEQALEKIK